MTLPTRPLVVTVNGRTRLLGERGPGLLSRFLAIVLHTLFGYNTGG